MKDQLNAISLAYEAALEPAKWPEALDAIAKVGHSKGALLCLIEQGTDEIFSFNKNNSIYAFEKQMNYLTKHGKYESDLWAAAVEKLNESADFSIVSDLELLQNNEQLIDAEAEADFINNFGVCRKLGVLLNKQAPWEDGLALQYSNEKDDFPKDARRNIASIAPYMARAASLIRPVHVLEAEHGALLDVIDRLAIGVAVVSSNGTLVLKNTGFTQILELGAFYLDPHQRLRAGDAEIDSKLRRSMNGTSKMSIGEDLDRGEFISIPIKDRMTPVSIEVSPLGRKGKDSPIQGWSIIFAVDPQWRLVTDATRLGVSYSLTNTEQAICSMVLEGLTNREMSDARSCGVETIKTHVSNLLTKTWTKNRTELARLAAVAELPLVE